MSDQQLRLRYPNLDNSVKKLLLQQSAEIKRLQEQNKELSHAAETVMDECNQRLQEQAADFNSVVYALMNAQQQLYQAEQAVASANAQREQLQTEVIRLTSLLESAEAKLHKQRQLTDTIGRTLSTKAHSSMTLTTAPSTARADSTDGSTMPRLYSNMLYQDSALLSTAYSNMLFDEEGSQAGKAETRKSIDRAAPHASSSATKEVPSTPAAGSAVQADKSLLSAVTRAASVQPSMLAQPSMQLQPSMHLQERTEPIAEEPMESHEGSGSLKVQFFEGIHHVLLGGMAALASLMAAEVTSALVRERRRY